MTVPSLEGMTIDELRPFLDERDLRFEVEPDSGYSPQFEPLAVLKQFPLAGSKVKQNRKIYITLNQASPPMVTMPSLTGRSLKNAQLELKSLGLSLGEITYEPDFALNTILEQYYAGQKIAEGESLPKGSEVDFVVGDGLGNQRFSMLDLRQMELDEATFVLRGYGLKVGEIFYKDEGKIYVKTINEEGEEIYETEEVDPGKVFKQNSSSQAKYQNR